MRTQEEKEHMRICARVIIAQFSTCWDDDDLPIFKEAIEAEILRRKMNVKIENKFLIP